MTAEQELIEKIKKLEALFAGSAIKGEQAAAQAAKERILNKLKETRSKEKDVEYAFYLSDIWSRNLMLALCKRYNIMPYRRHRQKYTTVMIKAPLKFIKGILWPEYCEMYKVLREYLEETTNKIIQKEIFGGSIEVEVVEDYKQISG